MNYTDEQIKQALKCCKGIGCKECPFRCGTAMCIRSLMAAILDLINRQEAEIERLQRHNKEYRFCNLLGNVLVYSKNLKDYNNVRKGLKSEAIKEFAERLKEKIHDSVYQYWNFGEGGYYLAEDVDDDIDNLVKEMCSLTIVQVLHVFLAF